MLYTQEKKVKQKRNYIHTYTHTHTHTYMYHLCQLMHEDYLTKKNSCLWVGLWSSLGVIPMRSMRSGYAVCWPTHFQLARIHNSWLPVDFSSVAQSCPALCKPMDCSTPGFPVHHQLPELAQTYMPSVTWRTRKGGSDGQSRCENQEHWCPRKADDGCPISRN